MSNSRNLHIYQTGCQIGIAVGIIITAICGFGSYFVGKKIVQIDKQEDQKTKEELQRQNEQIIEYLKKFNIEGDKELASQIRRTEKWDFHLGTVSFIILKDSFTHNKNLNLSIISEDNDASIKFIKNQNNEVEFIYSFPTIGEIIRKAQIVAEDINEIGVHFAFTWDLFNAETTLYINGSERK